MKKLLVALLFVPSLVFAKELFSVQIEATCVDAITFNEFLNEYKEEPLLSMVSVRKTNIPPFWEAYSTVLFVHKENKAWTLVEQRDDFYCITSMGEELKPHSKQTSGKRS